MLVGGVYLWGQSLARLHRAVLLAEGAARELAQEREPAYDGSSDERARGGGAETYLYHDASPIVDLEHLSHLL